MTQPKKVACLCCGFFTLEEEGAWEICPVCFWEDDRVQASYLTSRTGANRVSLLEARQNFARIGVSEERFKQYVRPPFPDEFPPQRKGV